MKLKIILITFLVVLVISGCSSIREFIDQVEIGNSFSDFSSGFSNILTGDGNFTGKAKESLASQVSMEIDIGEEVEPSVAMVQDLEEPFNVYIEIEDVSKNDFILFITENDREVVEEELDEELWDEWDKFQHLLAQEIDNLNISHNDTSFDEDTSFNKDTVDKIRKIINVKNNTADLTANLEMNINAIPYSGYIRCDFVKSSDWLVSKITVSVQPDDSN